MKLAELQRFAKEHALALGERYERFLVSDEAAQYKGRELDGAPHSEFGSRWGVSFLKPGFKLFTENQIARKKWPHLVPLAAVRGEAEFVAVDVRGEAPVLFWDHEEAQLAPFLPSLDAFLARLLRKQDKTLLQRIKSALKTGLAAVRANKYEQALAAVGPLVSEAETFRHVWQDDNLAELFNVYGMAVQGLGKHDEARRCFRRALQLGSDASLLNLMSSHLDAKDFKEVIGLGEHAAVMATEHAYWLMRYLVEAYLHENRLPDAERELRCIYEGNYKAQERMTETRQRLETFTRGKDPAAQAAKGYLQWFVFSKERPASLPAKEKKPSPTIDEMLALGEARAAGQGFSKGQGGISIALGEGRMQILTAYLKPGEDGSAIRRGDKLRLVGIRKVGGTKFMVVSKA